LQPRPWHAHHLFGDAVGLLLVDVARSIDLEFPLKPDWSFGVEGYPAEIMSEAG
jgi:hypothetical protein